MHPFQALLAAEHLDQLRRDAARDRLAREAASATDDPGRPSGFGLRRAFARLAFRLSRTAAGTATRLDPAIDDCFAGRRAVGAAGR